MRHEEEYLDFVFLWCVDRNKQEKGFNLSSRLAYLPLSLRCCGARSVQGVVAVTMTTPDTPIVLQSIVSITF